MTTIQGPEPGGFLQPILPSPPDSSVASPKNPVLPHPRSTPLKTGSLKQSSLIDHVDQKLLAISRRYELRSFASLRDDTSTAFTESDKGYESFEEVAKDMEGLVNIIWVSGTPSLQTPYLLTLAQRVRTMLPAFPFSPQPMFKLLHKLDLAFASLLRGSDMETGERLPGFEGGRGKLSTTEKVRIRGVVERTRVAVVEAIGKDGMALEVPSMSQTESDTEGDISTEDTLMIDTFHEERGYRRWEMEVARVYERSIVELGTTIDDASVRDSG